MADRRARVLVALVLTMGLAAMDTTIVATALPSVVADLGGQHLFAWVFSTYLLAQTVTIPLYGKLADLYGRKPVLIAGVATFLAASAACAAAPSMLALIVFRGIQGLGAGSIQATVATVAGDLYSIAERGRVQGWLSSVWGISALVGPAAGGLFSQYVSWRWIFLINLPLGGFALWMLVRHLTERIERKKHRIDYAGAALVLGATAALIVGLLSGGSRWPWLSAPSLAVFGVAAVLVGVAVVVERHAAEPVMPGWLWTRRTLVGANLTMVVLGLIVIGMNTVLPTYAQQVSGLSPTAAGFVLAAMSITWPISSSLSNRLYLRIGFRDTALAGTLLVVLATGVLVLVPASGPAWQLVVATVVMGGGFGLMSTSMLVGTQSTVRYGRRGVVTGGTMFGRYLGQSIGAAVYAAISNASLTAALAQPVPGLGPLPDQVDGIGRILAADPGSAVARYLRTAVHDASHQVFLALLGTAVLGVACVLIAPRRFPVVEDR
ncbi:MFS transporter [Actinocatenispora sera]